MACMAGGQLLSVPHSGVVKLYADPFGQLFSLFGSQRLADAAAVLRAFWAPVDARCDSE